MPDARTLKLKRQAGEVRLKAQKKLDDLKARIERQMEGKLAEGETKMTPAEIKTAKDEIEAMHLEAKEIEGLADVEGLATHEGAGGAAREILASADGERPIEALTGEARTNKAWRDLGTFLRAVRATSGPSESIELSQPTKAQVIELARAYQKATLFSRGEPFQGKDFNVNLSDEQFELTKKTLVGDNTGSAGRGDYLVPTQPMAELLRVMAEDQSFANRCRRIPMARRTMSFPRLKQTDNTVTRPLFSFAAVTKIGEGVQKDVREPVFEQLILTAIKYAAYLEASDELLTDSIVPLPPVLVELLTDAIGYEFDRDTMRGSGSGEPQGFIGSAAAWTQRRQTANQVKLGDIWGLEERFFGTDGIYLVHPSAVSQIGQFAVGNVLFWSRDISSSVPATLLGRAMVRSHKLPNLGTAGDVNLVDPSMYLVGDLQAITVANSIHFKFQNDVTAWRAVYRAAGTPWPAGLFSAEAASNKLTFRMSPFCVLGAVASS